MSVIEHFSIHQKFKSSIFSEKFINLLLIHGKKAKASLVYISTLELLNYKLLTHLEKISPKQNKIISIGEIVEQAITNCMPSLEVRKVRVAGSTYLVPAIIPKKKQEALAMRWIIEAAKIKKKKSKQSFAKCLAEEIFDAFSKQGSARTKRNELHRLAEANRAYIRYRWW
jgi:small subunit ribosomal protein S7